MREVWIRPYLDAGGSAGADAAARAANFGGALPRLKECDMCPDLSHKRCSTAIPAPLVLILEHDGGTRSAMCLLLHSAGYQVLLAAVLLEAMAIARRRCGLELLVMSAPVSCGTPAAQAICALREIAGQQLKVILLLDSLLCVPAELRQDSRVRLARKPVEPEALLAALNALRVH